MRFRFLPRIAGLLLATACASSGGGAPGSTDLRGTRRASDVITAEEIAEVDVAHAYDLVQRLRPAFLRARGKSANTQPQYATVYVDGIPRGKIEALRQITGSSVRTIRYLSGPQATIRFGIDHEGGAILVELK